MEKREGTEKREEGMGEGIRKKEWRRMRVRGKEEKQVRIGKGWGRRKRGYKKEEEKGEEEHSME